jgi:membrane-bound inhibitor of C-type lysozyme
MKKTFIILMVGSLLNGANIDYDLNGDGLADFVWKKGDYYSTWYMNSNGTHKFKYLGKVSRTYEVVGNSSFSETPTVTYPSKLFFNGNEKTTTISKSMSIGSQLEGIDLGFKPVINMFGEYSFSLKFKNGGFDLSNYHPVLCVGTGEVGNLLSLGNNYDSDNFITYNPTFQIYGYEGVFVSKNSLITFHKDSCNNDAQPIRTTSKKDVVIETQVVNGQTTQAQPLVEYHTNSVKIKVKITDESNQSPIVNAGDDKTIMVNNSVTLYGSGSDSDGSVTFEWKKGNTVLGTSATLTYTPTSVGTDTLTLTVTDNDGATASDSVEIVVEEDSSNDNLNLPTF